MRWRCSATFTLLALGVALGDARAEGDEPSFTETAAQVAALPALKAPALLHQPAPPPRHIALPEGHAARPLAGALSLDLSFEVIRLVVRGDSRPGLSTFLGTSTTTLGGFRLRF